MPCGGAAAGTASCLQKDRHTEVSQSRFRVWDLGFRVLGLGFRVQALDCSVFFWCLGLILLGAPHNKGLKYFEVYIGVPDVGKLPSEL